MSARADDACWMSMALGLGRRGRPAPNPHVGAVVVADGRLVAAGWHPAAGGPHAEIVALRAAKQRARGGVLYVTLEPCNHYGRTPPCVDAVLAAGIRRVVIGCRDPNPQVAGGGASRLRQHGLEVRVGVLRDAARDLISSWAVSAGLAELRHGS